MREGFEGYDCDAFVVWRKRACTPTEHAVGLWFIELRSPQALAQHPRIAGCRDGLRTASLESILTQAMSSPPPWPIATGDTVLQWAPFSLDIGTALYGLTPSQWSVRSDGCPVCHDRLCSVVFNCSHQLCNLCASHFFNGKCPLCRSLVTDQTTFAPPA